MSNVTFAVVQCLQGLTDQETGEKRVQIILDSDYNEISIIVSQETAREYHIGARVSLTLEVIDATH